MGVPKRLNSNKESNNFLGVAGSGNGPEQRRKSNASSSNNNNNHEKRASSPLGHLLPGNGGNSPKKGKEAPSNVANALFNGFMGQSSDGLPDWLHSSDRRYEEAIALCESVLEL